MKRSKSPISKAGRKSAKSEKSKAQLTSMSAVARKLRSPAKKK